MTKGLRKGLTSYGDAEFSLFLRKAFIKAMGYSDDALARPIIGITNTYSDYNPCHGNVPDLIESVKRGVMLAGGLPMVFPTISIHESFAHPTSMFLRNLMAMDTEEMIRAQPMDAVVVIGGCDKTLPAQVMAIGQRRSCLLSCCRPGRCGGSSPGRSFGRMYRLPAAVGTVPRRQDRRS
jgi:dihydroxy-acid dehydratase